MGLVYHTHHLDYFEAARTEALRELGLAYKELESTGIIMPVTEAFVRYVTPARYDDVLVVRTMFEPIVPEVRVKIDYEVIVEGSGKTTTTGHVGLCFFDTTLNRPVRAPLIVKSVFEKAISAGKNLA